MIDLRDDDTLLSEALAEHAENRIERERDANECPNCGSVYDTAEGLNKHHYMKHPEDWQTRLKIHIDLGDPDECWEYQLRRSKAGYGQTQINGERFYTHRLVYRMVHGPMPKPQINHHCDNPPCVNPRHLYSGTHKENMLDSAERNREAHVNPKTGEDNGSAVLNQKQAKEIKERLASGETPTELEKDYPVSSTTIQDIQYGNTWSHI